MQFRYYFFAITIFFSFVCYSFAQQPINLRHGGIVRTVKFSPVDSSVLASAGDNNTIKLWDWRNNSSSTLRGHTGLISSVDFSPDGKLLVSGGDDWTFRLWDVDTHSNIATLQHVSSRNRYQVKDVEFSPDGKMLATAAQHVKLWDIASKDEVATLRHDKYVWTLAFSPDGKLLAAGDAGGIVRIWDVATQKAVAQFEGDTVSVYALDFSSDGRTLASAGYNGLIKLWSVSDWTLLGSLQNPGTVYTLDFYPGGKALVSTGYGAVTLWSVEDGEEIVSFKGHSVWFYAAAFSHDGKTLARGGDDGSVRVQNIESYLQTLQQREMVRLIYFLPNNRSVQLDIDTKLDTLIKDVQQFYAEQMHKHGFDRKTFTFETNVSGNAVVHHVNGTYSDSYYDIDTATRVSEEIGEQFNLSQDLYLIALDTGSEKIDHHWCGQGGLHGSGGGKAIVPASGICFDGENGVVVVAHEIGHALGLKHDFRDNAYLMSYGINRDQLSYCAAEWLNVSRYFNNSQISFNEPTKIVMHPPIALPSNKVHFRFEVTDADGLYQAQFVIPSAVTDPADGIKLHSCKLLNSESILIDFTTNELTVDPATAVDLQVIDTNGFLSSKTFPVIQNQIVQVDINNDGRVNVADLCLVASNLGTSPVEWTSPNLDINKDGFVNRDDILLIVEVLEAGYINLDVPSSIATVSLAPVAVESSVVGERITFSLNIIGGKNVAGYQVTVQFDPTSLRYAGRSNGDYLSSGAFFMPPKSRRNTVTFAASSFAGESTGDGTLATVVFEVLAVHPSTVKLSDVLLTDSTGNTTTPEMVNAEITASKGLLTPLQQLPEDVNEDGVVNIVDLTLVSSNFGMRGGHEADVNGDGVVNIVDLMLVAAAFGDAAAAPMAGVYHSEIAPTRSDVVKWLNAARRFNSSDPVFQRGILVLDSLLNALTPKTTLLLPNYPNPFNPETWIPYHLAMDTDVKLHIYATNGTLVRSLDLGHQTAGIYQNRNRAAYWDGKNEIGESVTSGIYFCTLSAGGFSATCKMLILK